MSDRLIWSTRSASQRTVEADDPLLKGLPEPVDRLAALTRRHADGARVVRVPAEAQLDRAVVLRLPGGPTHVVRRR